MTPLAGGNVVYPFLSAAVAFSAFSYGLGPSALMVAVALFGVRYWFINPSIPSAFLISHNHLASWHSYW